TVHPAQGAKGELKSGCQSFDIFMNKWLFNALRGALPRWWLLAILLSLPAPLHAADFSTAGVERLQPFFAKTDATGPVTILSFGDSMADSYQSLNFVLMNRFIERLGAAGYSFDNYAGNTLAYPTNGAFYTPPDSFWFTS